MRTKIGIDMEDSAMRFATVAHRNQKRKYTGEQYIEHPKNVVNILKTLVDTTITSEMIQAAWLHDVVEDCNIDLSVIKQVFGDTVAELVEMLTDKSKPEDGNRAVRKQIDLEHTAVASADAKTIKLADLIDNSTSIIERDKEFAKIYLNEKSKLLNVLKEGNTKLWEEARRTAITGLAEIEAIHCAKTNKQKRRAAIKQVFKRLSAMPRDTLIKLMKEHENGDIAIILRETGAFKIMAQIDEFGYHEIVDRSSNLQTQWYEQVENHGATQENKKLSALAEKISKLLFEFYQEASKIRRKKFEYTRTK
jgi:(p)ppGpp synthase/HD superfamily hydrolase